MARRCEGGVRLMARMVSAQFCEHHTTAADGKNSYIGVFDNMTVRIRCAKGKPLPKEPLPIPVPSLSFTLALYLTTAPGSPVCVARLKDPDDQVILPEMKSKLQHNAEGKHRWHLHFPKGIPLRKSGIHTFEVEIEGEELRPSRVDLPVTLDIKTGGAT